MKDTLVCMERHGEVAGVSDLDDVGSDIPNNDVAKIQDVFWQMNPEMVLQVLVTNHQIGHSFEPKA